MNPQHTEWMYRSIVRIGDQRSKWAGSKVIERSTI